MDKFTISLDKTTSVITKVVWIVVLAVIALVLLSSIVTFLLSPRSYFVQDDKLVVKRIVGSVTTHKDEISSFRELRLSETGALSRTMASGGFHGHFGFFRSGKLGSLTLMATRLDKAVIIYRNDKNPLVLSPDDIPGFLASLQRLTEDDEKVSLNR